MLIVLIANVAFYLGTQKYGGTEFHFFLKFPMSPHFFLLFTILSLSRNSPKPLCRGESVFRIVDRSEASLLLEQPMELRVKKPVVAGQVAVASWKLSHHSP